MCDVAAAVARVLFMRPSGEWRIAGPWHVLICQTAQQIDYVKTPAPVSFSVKCMSISGPRSVTDGSMRMIVASTDC